MLHSTGEKQPSAGSVCVCACVRVGVAEGVLVHTYEFVLVCTVLACTHVLGLCGRAWVCKCVHVQTSPTQTYSMSCGWSESGPIVCIGFVSFAYDSFTSDHQLFHTTHFM